MVESITVKSIVSAAGGQSAVARKFGIQRQAVDKWTRVPAERVLVVSEMSGVPPHKIRPDIYPAPHNGAEGKHLAVREHKL